MKRFQIIIPLLIVLTGLIIINLSGFKSQGFSIDMVDDVIHDKYEKNSDAYYSYRIKKDEERLKNDPNNLILYDDLAVGYDNIGKMETALELYKTKKSLMEKSEKYDMMNWYRYHANLGTFLIHHGMKGFSKDKNDNEYQKIVIEGRNHIAKAIKMNAEAHFGRENYQLIANDWIISSFKNPDIMTLKNMLGKKSMDPELLDGKNTWVSCGKAYHDTYPETKKAGKSLDEQIKDSCPMALKGIIGMIRYGGGPNPYSFVAIGDILTSMGEYPAAFASYARAVKMNHPNSNKIIGYSKILAHKIHPGMSMNEAYNKAKDQFDKDYAIGKTWSDNYLVYQKKIIAEGKDPTLTEKYDPFYKEFKKPVDVKYDRSYYFKDYLYFYHLYF